MNPFTRREVAKEVFGVADPTKVTRETPCTFLQCLLDGPSVPLTLTEVTLREQSHEMSLYRDPLESLRVRNTDTVFLPQKHTHIHSPISTKYNHQTASDCTRPFVP